MDYYGDRIVTLAVFGSVGRETQRHDSDTDILIIAKGLPKGRIKRVQEFEEVEEKLSQYFERLEKLGIKTYLSPIIKTPDEAEQGSALFLDMIADVQMLYDKNGFFSKILERLKVRLDDLGAQRIKRGNAWYWILKPDFRPGEVFEL
jgi:predicted nucleotidyltransferase